MAAALAWLYVSCEWYQGRMSAGWTIFCNALAISILHEMVRARGRPAVLLSMGGSRLVLNYLLTQSHLSY